MTITAERSTETVTGASTKGARAMRKAIGGTICIFTATVRGEMWATDSHWAAPVHPHFSVLWTATPTEGTWYTGSNDKSPAVRSTIGQAPNLAVALESSWHELKGAHVLEPVQLDGLTVHDVNGNPIYRTPDGTLQSVDKAYVALLVGDKVHRLTMPADGKALAPVTVWSGLSVTLAQTWKKEIHWHRAGMLMPIRLQPAKR